MRSEGRIADGQETQVAVWQPEEDLPSVSQEEARYSRGFIPADALAWFPTLAEHWLPLFHIIGGNITFRGCEKRFSLPDEKLSTSIFEIDGEKGVLGCSPDGAAAAAALFIPGAGEVGSDVLLEYLHRRLLSSLVRSWGGADSLNCHYLHRGSAGEAEIAAALGLNLQSEGNACSFWLGIGPRTLERLDSAWRKKLLDDKREHGGDILSDEIFAVSIEVAELAVPPAMLIDYVRSGTIIDLEVPVSKKVKVKLNGRPWTEGSLCQFRGRCAVKMTNLTPQPVSFPQGTMRMRVVLSLVDLDQQGVLEHAQNGAVLLTDAILDNRVSLIVNGENVASAVLGRLGQNFALRVLPK